MNSTERVEEAIDRIAEIDHNGYRLNSVLALAEDAGERAQEYDRLGNELPLGGLPILIKDNIEAVGLPATAGSIALLDTPVDKDSTIAQRLREAGAVIVGATNLSEWANIRSSKSTSGWSAVGGLTANPWKHRHSAGGSSSGSGAAVAAGLTQWAIGTETDGSIICPASLNGCVGIKPTVGSVPRDRVIPISSSQDSPGPITQTVSQAALLLDVLTNKSVYSAATKSDHNIKIGVVPQWMTENNEVNQTFEDAVKKLESSGVTLVEVNLTPPNSEAQDDELFVLLYELYRDLSHYLKNRDRARVLNLQDVVDFNIVNFEEELKHFGQEHFEKALEIQNKKDEYENARSRNKSWADRTISQGIADVDILIGCTYGPAWESSLERGDSYDSASWITMAPAIAGTPIGTIPMGLVSGLPVGLGFVAARDQESELIAAMARAEAALGLGVLRPSFVK